MANFLMPITNTIIVYLKIVFVNFDSPLPLPAIMTNHVHLVFRSSGEQKPELLIGDFKRFTSKAIVKAIIENAQESRKEFLL